MKSLATSLLALVALVLVQAPARASEPGKTADASGTQAEEEPSAKETEKTDSGEDGALPLGEVVVTAHKISRVTRLVSGEDIERTLEADTVEGLFETEPGMDLNRRSPGGPESSRLSIRGFDESRYAVLWGLRDLRGAGVYGGAYVDWSVLSFDDVERVEIIRGASPVKYGNTLGGVVNVVPKRPSGTLSHFIRNTVGTLGTNSLQAGHAFGAGPASWKLVGALFNTDGYLRNAFVERRVLSAEVALRLPEDFAFSASVRHTENESGMTVYNRPDSPYYDDDFPKADDDPMGGPYLKFLEHTTGPLDWGDGSYWKDVRDNVNVSLARKTDTFRVAARAYLMEQVRDEYFHAVTDPDRLVVHRRSRPEQDNGGFRAEIENELALAGKHEIEFGIEGHYLGYGSSEIRFVDPSYFPPWAVPRDHPGKHHVSKRHGVYIQDDWEPAPWLRFYAGLRFDHFEAIDPQEGIGSLIETPWSPGAGVRVRPFEKLEIAARYRRAHRFPTLPEYYWYHAGYQPADRKDLRSERADQIDVEATVSLPGRLQGVLRGYAYRVDHYLRTIFGYKPSRVVYNIDGVTLAGFEAEASLFLAKGLQAWANYTWQTSEKHGDVLDKSAALSSRLTELPEHKFNLGVRYETPWDLTASVKGRFVSRRQAVVGNAATASCRLEDLDPFFDLALDLSWTFWKADGGRRGEFFLSLSNLLNQDIEEQYGYPLPRFSASGGWIVKF